MEGMRKFIVLIVLAILIGALYPLTVTEEGVSESVAGGKPYVIFYLNDPVYIEGAETSRGGSYWEMRVSFVLVDEIRNKLPEIKGESLTMRGVRKDAEKCLTDRNAVIRSEQKIEGTEFIYAYTRSIRNYVTLEGEKVNLQIALREDGIMIIGTPLILGAC
jgi:hypothetical protein